MQSKKGADAAAGRLAHWQEAMRWRRKVEQALAAVDLTFTQWLLLDCANELIREKGDAISQSELAARSEVDRMTVSQVLKTLESRDCIDRGPALEGRAYRVWVTPRGRTAARKGRALVEEASVRD